MVIVGILSALKINFISSDPSFVGSAAKDDPIFLIAALISLSVDSVLIIFSRIFLYDSKTALKASKNLPGVEIFAAVLFMSSSRGRSSVSAEMT